MSETAFSYSDGWPCGLLPTPSMRPIEVRNDIVVNIKFLLNCFSSGKNYFLLF
jgi:hypothetical protein